MDENAIVGTVVGITASASDADATTNAITYSLLDNDGGRFAIDSSTGVVTVAGAIDREADGASRNITVRATSADGSFTDQVFAININDVDEFDVGAVTDTDGAANEVDENAIVGTAVGITASASDADATTNAITYTLLDNDGGRFAIDCSTGVVTVAGAIDREADGATRNITVRATVPTDRSPIRSSRSTSTMSMSSMSAPITDSDAAAEYGGRERRHRDLGRHHRTGRPMPMRPTMRSLTRWTMTPADGSRSTARPVRSPSTRHSITRPIPVTT